MSNQSFTILLVEDIERHQKIYADALTDALPVSVTTASTGRQAVAMIFEDKAPDLIVLDLTLPELSGEQVLEQVRADHRFQHIPIIILTGTASTDKQMDLLEAGADDFIEKGSHPDIFVARIRAQMRHKLAVERLTRMAVERDMFAAGVLHDIRNIETGIVTGCQLIRRLLKKDPQGNKNDVIGYLRDLSSQASKLGNYAEDVIQSVRAQRQDLMPESIDLAEMIRWIIGILSKNDAGTGSQPAGWEISGNVNPVLADRHFLRLALMNIIQNAIKYAKPEAPAKIIVTQETFDAGDDKGSCAITRFRDHGIGIPRDELTRVFEPFVRSSENTGNKTGFGLGLSLVAKVTTKMGGRVWAELPEEGPGTVICLELPAAGL